MPPFGHDGKLKQLKQIPKYTVKTTNAVTKVSIVSQDTLSYYNDYTPVPLSNTLE